MNLCGFLAPDGTFTECDCWSHMATAKSITNSKFNQNFHSGLDAEDFLYENGYVGFYARGAGHRWVSKNEHGIILLTSKQKDFIESHLDEANNSDQRKEMEEILDFDDAYREGLILKHY